MSVLGENIPNEMRALVLPAPGSFEIQTVPVPTPRGDEALCRVRAMAIYGSDPEILRGDLAGTWRLPIPSSGSLAVIGPGPIGLLAMRLGRALRAG